MEIVGGVQRRAAQGQAAGSAHFPEWAGAAFLVLDSKRFIGVF
jgi:hypothetical protein